MPTHPNLTSFMFPFTPVELQEGYVIGEGRIRPAARDYRWG